MKKANYATIVINNWLSLNDQNSYNYTIMPKKHILLVNIKFKLLTLDACILYIHVDCVAIQI
jgi:hypothetical protein